ncbi:MAG TPA: nitrilase-related carbon-nitrogen hydrolase [Candidatus Gastranaerophilales bacterium]|nr:nitrilase-related carbon-nitrogen hydrolase [Candidatus Gastranaerophilales bacterium]
MDKVKAGLIQTKASGNKKENIEKTISFIEKGVKKDAQIFALQELFFAPYFPAEQNNKWFDWAEPITGSTIETMRDIAKKHKIVLVVPVFEESGRGIYYNTTAVIDIDGSLKGIYRKNHIPHLEGFWEKFYFKPGNLGYPVFETAYCKIGVYTCYDRHFPEGARALGLAGAEVVFNPSATVKNLSKYLWELEQPAHAAANMYYIGAVNRVGKEALSDGEYYGTSYFVNPRGEFLAKGSETKEELVMAELDLEMISETRKQWQFYRDRRPETYNIISDMLP